MKHSILSILSLLGITALSAQSNTVNEGQHLKNLRQLTLGGDNAEAYFSFDGQKLVFQSNNKEWGLECDQIFYSPIESLGLHTDGNTGQSVGPEKPMMVSTGMGRTTCSYFMPGDELMMYAYP